MAMPQTIALHKCPRCHFCLSLTPTWNFPCYLSVFNHFLILHMPETPFQEDLFLWAEVRADNTKMCWHLLLLLSGSPPPLNNHESHLHVALAGSHSTPGCITSSYKELDVSDLPEWFQLNHHLLLLVLLPTKNHYRDHRPGRSETRPFHKDPDASRATHSDFGGCCSAGSTIRETK